jgi:HSP20 family protein
MTLIRRPPPFADLVSLRDTMEQFFDERFMRPMWPFDGERRMVPALDLYTTPEAVIAKVALPGVQPEAVEVTITGTSSRSAALSKRRRRRRPRPAMSTRN